MNDPFESRFSEAVDFSENDKKIFQILIIGTKRAKCG
jgi:hypothetical protein